MSLPRSSHTGPPPPPPLPLGTFTHHLPVAPNTANKPVVWSVLSLAQQQTPRAPRSPQDGSRFRGRPHCHWRSEQRTPAPQHRVCIRESMCETQSTSWLGLVVRRSDRKRKGAGLTPRFGSPFSSKILIYGHCLATLPCTINQKN